MEYITFFLLLSQLSHADTPHSTFQCDFSLNTTTLMARYVTGGPQHSRLHPLEGAWRPTVTDPFQASHGCAMVIPPLDSQISRNFGSPLVFRILLYLLLLPNVRHHTIFAFFVFKSIFPHLFGCHHFQGFFWALEKSKRMRGGGLPPLLGLIRRGGGSTRSS